MSNFYDLKSLLEEVEGIESCIDILQRKLKSNEISQPFYELMTDILSYTYQDNICEDFHGSEYLYKSPVKQLVNDDRISISDLEVFHAINDVGQIGKLFRDSRFETFWILAVKNDKVIGAKGVTNKLPGTVNIHPYKKEMPNMGAVESAINIYFNWLYRIGADSYLLLHNHPSNDTAPTDEDIDITMTFADILTGFRGHVIVGIDNYTFIDDDMKASNFHYEDEGEVVTDEYDKEVNLMKSPSSIERIGIEYLKSDSNFLVIYVSPQQRLVGVEQFQNKDIDYLDFEKYVANQKRENHASMAFIYTTSKQVMDDCGLLRFSNIINSVIFSDEETHKLYDQKSYGFYRDKVPVKNIKDFYKYNRFNKK